MSVNLTLSDDEARELVRVLFDTERVKKDWKQKQKGA
jgi:hypothetical protein